MRNMLEYSSKRELSKFRGTCPALVLCFELVPGFCLGSHFKN